MNYEIVELVDFSGIRATIYTVINKGHNITLFDQFLLENHVDYRTEVASIINRLIAIGQTTGARETFFKHHEGKLGDGVCALYDTPKSKLRLYCIRCGNSVVIIGGGGPKSSSIRAWQEDKKLTTEVNHMIKVSKDILDRLRSGDLKWSKDGHELLGNLNFTDDEE